MQLEERRMHSNGMAWFKGLESHLKTLYPISGFFVTHKTLFESTFRTFFGEEHQDFRKKMFHNLDQLRWQFDRENLHEVNAKTCLKVLRTQFKQFFASKGVTSLDYLNQLDQENFKDYTGCEPETYRSNLLVHLDILEKFIDKSVLNYAILHEHEIEQSLKLQSKDVQIKCYGNENSISDAAFSNLVNERQMQMPEGKVDTVKELDNAYVVVTDSSGTESEKQDTCSRSGNATHVEDADIRPVNDEEPMAEDAEKCQDTSPLLGPSFTNKTTEFSNQSLESENISLKKTVAQFQKDFSRMEAHCVNLELKYQNQALKFGQHGQILNKTSNKAKIKKEIEVLETINIEFEISVAKLLAENEQLHKENEHLKQTCKDLYDSIKKTRIQTKDRNDSLVAQVNSKTVENADSKAQIQEKVFANATLKNELRKLKGNNVDTKFLKPSILGKPALQPLRIQSVVRQPNAFKSERPKFLKQRFASQVDVKNDLPKQVTPHYLAKGRESVFAKPYHVIASNNSRNSSKNMPRFSSNDMIHNHYLEEAKKKTQEKDRNSKTSVMPYDRLQNTANGSQPKPRSTNKVSRNWPASKSREHSRNSRPYSDSKHFVYSTCQKCAFNANHDAYITKFLNEVNSRAKSSQDIDFLPISFPLCMRKRLQDLVLGGNRQVEFSRLLALGDYLLEGYSPLAQQRYRSGPELYLMTSKYFSLELGFKEKKSVRFSALYLQKKRNLLIFSNGRLASEQSSSGPALHEMAFEQSSSGPALHEMTPGTISSGLVQNPPSTTPYVPPTKNDWDVLFQPMFDEYFNPPSSV
ncbi:hypothetical protein Tco_0813101 [Tanacetum coccineum]